MKNRTSVTYVRKASSADITNLVKAVGVPIAVFLLSIYMINMMKNFGSLLMAPAIAAMWLAGVIMAIIMPAQRRSILNETMGFIAGYNGTIFMLHNAVAIVSGVSPEMIMETFNMPVPSATASAVSGYLMHALMLSALIVPITFLGFQGKRLITFRKSRNKTKMLKQLRSVRHSGENS